MTYAEDIASTLGLFFRITEAEVLELRRLYAGVAESLWLRRDDIPEVAAVVANNDQPHVGAHYITLNPVRPALLSRSHAFWRRTQATSDADIVCRRQLLIDLDPARPAKTNSNDIEKAAARERAQDCAIWIGHRFGWDPPIVADSGNGFHLLYGLDRIAITEESDHWISDCLKLLHKTFSDELLTVDTAVGNPSRVTKLYETWVRKGEPTFERPWRKSALLEVPD